MFYKFYWLQMSTYNSRNASGNRSAAVIDYDRQFQEDLERAQALSLESLALEKFRMQKQQQQQRVCINTNGHERSSYGNQSTGSGTATSGSNSETDGPAINETLV